MSDAFTVRKHMIQRCYNPNNPKYPRYGGRGITVCDRWLGDNGLRNFIEDMGQPPEGLSLDRIDNDGNYEPANCKWSTSSEQSNNTHWANKVTYKVELRPCRNGLKSLELDDNRYMDESRMGGA
jgi:hypothetical protein